MKETEPMSAKTATVEYLLFGQPGAAGAAAMGKLEENDQATALKSKLAETTDVAWENVSEEVGGAIKCLLDIGLDDIIFGAWAKIRDLRRYRDAEKFPPDEIILVPLAKHSITSTHKPRIEVMVGDKRVGRIDFRIELKLDLEGVVLKVRDGKIWEIKAGSCQGEGRLTAGAVELVKKKTDKFDLPGMITLSEGFQIPER